MMADLPAPLVPAEVDLRGLPWMPLDTQRLLDSDLFALANAEEFRAAVTLWCKAWQQVPAGSLPSDDRVLAHLSGTGSRWPKVKAMALRGFVLCNDGRLYHSVLVEKVADAWSERVRNREKQRKWREKSQVRNGDKDGNVTVTETDTLPVTQPLRNAGSDRTGQGQGQGLKENPIPPNPLPGTSPGERALAKSAETAAQRQAFEAWWQGYPKKLGKAKAEEAWLRIKPDEGMRAVLTAAVAAQREWETWKRDGGRFIPYPATWLNGKRWADEADAIAGPGGYDWKAIARAAGYSEQEIAADAPH
jgi:hypothetical protein